ncbi:MAG: 2-amino-4-hydroxy-6-hydroxymethyldihydropteridine diphosphokinase [Gammaproteobacteria bacterium]
MNKALAYVGIGSNQGDPVSIVRDAIACLDHISNSEVTRHSSLYQSEPLGDIPQDDYINAVAGLETSLPPTTLLLELQSIEDAFYRRRDPALKWGPRTLDLDIILYGNQSIDDSHLTVPHPGMAKRLFVLQPLLEITGDIDIPGLGGLQDLIDRAPAIEISKIDA